MKQFGGKVLFLDRSDINTDEIIPAKYLTEISKEALKPYCLEDLKLDGFDPKKDVAGKAVIITRKNFGCGSSREHAPWALEVNGITAVIAVNFARIFRQNMFNGGMLAIELPEETINMLFEKYKNTDATLYFDLRSYTFTIEGGGKKDVVSFKLNPFDAELVKAGGWVEYADRKY
ncbi:MAG: 3-isopropylmalate dehydratase small subunit [Brevinematia bacterium]